MSICHPGSVTPSSVAGISHAVELFVCVRTPGRQICIRTITRFHLEAKPQVSAEENSGVLQEHVLGAVRTLRTTPVGPTI